MDSTTSENQLAFPLFEYEKRFIRDKSRLKGWLKARQIGGSTTAALDCVLDAVRTGNQWNIMSRSGRQATSFLEKAAKHVLAINAMTTRVHGRRPIVIEKDITTEKIPLLNGATISAMPCDPDTTTGETCNWILDEFGLFPRSERVFGVIKPSIRWGKRIIVLSTARGRRNKFYSLWRDWLKDGSECGWNWHKTTINEAVADGCPMFDHDGNEVSLEQFKAQEVRDIGPDMYRQEYECEFLEESIVLLSIETIRNCINDNLPLVRTPAALAALDRDLFVGMDIGRKHDRSVIWVISITGENTYQTESVHVFENTPFAQQEQLLREIILGGRVAKCAIDAQGIGMQLTEDMQEEFPGIVEAINLTSALKDQMSSRVRLHMQAREFWVPADDQLVEDFNSIEKVFTDQGRPVITAPRNEAGHADRFWAAALALHVAAVYEPFRVVMAG